jgi:hypothetical protein
LITSLPVEIVDSSEVVRSYFNRWPAEESQFKSMKATVSLNKVAGYGKQKIEDEQVVKRQEHAALRINELKKILEQPLEQIRAHEESIAKLIPEERCLRNQSKIEEGKRKLTAELMEKLNSYEKQIRRHDTREKSKKLKRDIKLSFNFCESINENGFAYKGKKQYTKLMLSLSRYSPFIA